MSKKLYVGSIPYCIGKKELEKIFSEYGTVVSANIVLDPDTGLGKGFGFVEMSSTNEAIEAIRQISGTLHGGRKLVVTESKKKNHKSRGNKSNKMMTSRLYGVRERRNNVRGI